MQSVRELEAKLGHEFANPDYLFRALTHRSVSGEDTRAGDNEQLEFLGDAVLGFLVSEALVAARPEAREGVLSRLKSHLVSAEHLHQCALTLGLGEHLRLGRGEERNGGRERKALLADAIEAIIAAVYLDGGMEPARRFVHSNVLRPLDSTTEMTSIEQLNHKSILQERAQALGLPVPRYVTVATTGPEHAKQFVVEARVGDRYSAQATGSSKKSASQSAAGLLLDQLPSPQ